MGLFYLFDLPNLLELQMSADDLGDIIRSEKDQFKTPNLYRYLGQEVVEVHNENFRKNQQDQELILFFKYEDEIYFPLWFEFRSINNNLLFLLKEYEIEDFSTLKAILKSSLEKEEQYQATINALVYETKRLPPHAIKLSSFKISEDDMVLVKEV